MAAPRPRMLLQSRVLHPYFHGWIKLGKLTGKKLQKISHLKATRTVKTSLRAQQLLDLLSNTPTRYDTSSKVIK